MDWGETSRNPGEGNGLDEGPTGADELDTVSKTAPAGEPSPAGAYGDNPEHGRQPSVSPNSAEVELVSLDHFLVVEQVTGTT